MVARLVLAHGTLFFGVGAHVPLFFGTLARAAPNSALHVHRGGGERRDEFRLKFLPTWRRAKRTGVHASKSYYTFP